MEECGSLDARGNNRHPKVLLVLMTKVKADDPGSLLIRTQFDTWPKDKLAQIHSGEFQGTGEFCASYYRLDDCDRRFGRLFHRLRASCVDAVSMDVVEQNTEPISFPTFRRWSKILRRHLGEVLIRSGLWEVVFEVRVSKSMEGFIERFAPDLIYCQGYSIGYAMLPLLIERRFRIPICFQTTDDWPSYTYHTFPVGWLLRRRARQLIARSTVCMAFGVKMQQAYSQRYNKNFLVTYHADRFERFSEKVPEDVTHTRAIVFTGSLGLRRYDAIDDLLKVVRSLNDGPAFLEIHVYCTGIPKEIPKSLRIAREVKFMRLPSHDSLPSVLRQANVLFLPESFSVDPGMLDLSLSTKCHLYMMSGRPILAYGPSYSGTIDYACREGWAEVVTERNEEQLRSAVRRLAFDDSYSGEALIRRAKDVALRNHSEIVCQSNFRHAMLLALAGSCDAAT